MPRLTPLAAATTLALLLSACANFAPDYERPAAPVPAQLPAASVSAPEAVLPRWDALVREPRLQSLVRLALQHNRDLRVASLNLEKARAQLQVADADRWPTINAVFSGARQPNYQGVQSTTWTAGLGVTSYEADLWGRVRNTRDAASAALLASDASRRSTELGVVAGVASAWLTLAADEELLSLAQRTLRTREETLKLTALRVKVGAAADPERLAAESLTAQARANLAQVQRQRQADEGALMVLLGQPVPAELRPSPTTDDRSALIDADWLAPLQPGTSSQVLLQRPDLIAAEQQLVGANANIGAARAARFPRLALTGSAGGVSNDLSRLLTDPTFAWTLVGQASAAIFDAGRNSANVRIAEINRDIALAQYEKAIQGAFKEAADAIVGLDTWQQQLVALQQQLRNERERARLTTLRYEQGATSALDQLDSQRSLFATEQAVIQTRLAELQNRLGLYKALGGWPGETVTSAAAASASTTRP